VDDPVDPGAGTFAPDLKRARPVPDVAALQARALSNVAVSDQAHKQLRPAPHRLVVWTEQVEWDEQLQHLTGATVTNTARHVTVRRPYRIEAIVNSRAVGDRDEVPRPIASFPVSDINLAQMELKATVTSEIGDLGEFDKGHLIALMLNGIDSSWQIVPQVRDCNRNAWQAVENLSLIQI